MRTGVTATVVALWLLLVVEVRSSAPFLVSSKTSSGGLAILPPKKLASTSSWRTIPRGGGDVTTDSVTVAASAAAASMASSSSSTPESKVALLSIVLDSLNTLKDHLIGAKSDTLLLLATTALNTPLCKNVLKISPIIGFLLLGVLFGPNGLSLIQDVHSTELLADIGIVFFLFEMGIHLNFDTLMKMRRDVFGLGLSQFLVTAVIVGGICALLGLPLSHQIILGGSLALSSSAFVLQLLKDKDKLSTQFGRSSFGVLLLQDLAVVPLLVITPILAGSGGGIGAAVSKALVQATVALSIIAVAGTFFLKPLFAFVDRSNSQDAMIGAILGTVLSMSFLTEGLGLSNTLGAFLAGVLLSETPQRHKIEQEISPFRGVLVGLFFFTVGFEIDLKLIASQPLKILGLVLGLMSLKAVVAGVLALAFGLSPAIAQHVGLILSQGGEFAFVAFRLARSFDILDSDFTKLLLTVVSLTMGLTPFMEEFGNRMAIQMEAKAKDGSAQEKKKRI